MTDVIIQPKHTRSRCLRASAPSVSRTTGPHGEPYARHCSRAVLHRAVLLLEVVVALAVLVSAMGLLGAQLVGGIQTTIYAEEQTRAVQMADRMLAFLELDPNTVQQFVIERQADGDFGEQYPEWFWRAYAEELEETEALEEQRKLSRVTIEILYQPGVGEDADVEQARVVRKLHMLKAAPGTIDLEKDFGVPANKVEQIKELIAGIAPEAFTEDGELDIRALMQYTGIEDLFTLMPMLAGMTDGGLAGMGGGAGDLAGFIGGQNFSPEDLTGLLQGNLPDGLSLEMIQTFLNSAGGLEGLGDLGDLGDLANLAGSADINSIADQLGGGGGMGEVLKFIQSQLGSQLSADELNQLMGAIGQPGVGNGGRGGEGNGGGRGGRGGGDRRPTIQDLADERNERNREWRGKR